MAIIVAKNGPEELPRMEEQWRIVGGDWSPTVDGSFEIR